MYQRFNDLADQTATGKKSSVRALQAWQYLIGKASNRQTVKYDELKQLMGYSDNRPLGVILGCIMFYCEQNSLPSLTLIVVNKEGVPGEGFTAEKLRNYHKKREAVFDFPWFTIVPPTMAELHEARVEA